MPQRGRSGSQGSEGPTAAAGTGAVGPFNPLWPAGGGKRETGRPALVPGLPRVPSDGCGAEATPAIHMRASPERAISRSRPRAPLDPQRETVPGVRDGEARLALDACEGLGATQPGGLLSRDVT